MNTGHNISCCNIYGAALIAFFILLGISGCYRSSRESTDTDEQVAGKQGEDTADDDSINTGTDNNETINTSSTDNIESDTGESDEQDPFVCNFSPDSDVVYSPCDGYDIDCRTDCWECASYWPCCQILEECGDNADCRSFYTCVELECCESPEAAYCHSIDDYQECLTQCRESTGASQEAVDIYLKYVDCIVCDVCRISCGVESETYSVLCVEEPINNPSNPCYSVDATEGEIACFSWAGWGGPCTAPTSACKANAECTTLETCIDDSWSSNDWENIQEQCFLDATSEAETLYWAYVQCIYCDACDLACAYDAGNKNCNEYAPE